MSSRIFFKIFDDPWSAARCGTTCYNITPVELLLSKQMIDVSHSTSFPFPSLTEYRTYPNIVLKRSYESQEDFGFCFQYTTFSSSWICWIYEQFKGDISLHSQKCGKFDIYRSKISIFWIALTTFAKHHNFRLIVHWKVICVQIYGRIESKKFHRKWLWLYEMPLGKLIMDCNTDPHSSPYIHVSSESFNFIARTNY